MKKTLAALFTAFTLSVAACGGSASAAGVYELDKAAFKESMLANMPPEAKKEKAAMDMIDGMFANMNITIELKADGSATMTNKGMPGQKDDTETGTWKLEGSSLKMTTKGKDGKDETKTANYAAGSFSVEMEEEGKKMKMTFKKK